MILITDSGPHPPDKWAAVAGSFVADLVQIDEKSNSQQAAIARKGKRALIETISNALEAAFQSAMTDEQSRIDNGQVVTRTDPFQVDQYLTAVLASVVDAARTSPFMSHFAKPGVQTAARNILKQVFIDALNNQRSFAFDKKGL